MPGELRKLWATCCVSSLVRFAFWVRVPKVNSSFGSIVKALLPIGFWHANRGVSRSGDGSSWAEAVLGEGISMDLGENIGVGGGCLLHPLWSSSC